MDIKTEREEFEAWVIENLADGRSMSWKEWCWKSWQAAKAQVVPEGFVLVSKNELKMELCSIRDLNNGEHSNSIIEDCVCNIEAMVEAQEQK